MDNRIRNPYLLQDKETFEYWVAPLPSRPFASPPPLNPGGGMLLQPRPPVPVPRNLGIVSGLQIGAFNPASGLQTVGLPQVPYLQNIGFSSTHKTRDFPVSVWLFIRIAILGFVIRKNRHESWLVLIRLRIRSTGRRVVKILAVSSSTGIFTSFSYIVGSVSLRLVRHAN